MYKIGDKLSVFVKVVDVEGRACKIEVGGCEVEEWLSMDELSFLEKEASPTLFNRRKKEFLEIQLKEIQRQLEEMEEGGI